MSNQVTGRCFIFVKGVRIESKDGATLHFSDVKREAVAADTGVAGYMESTDVPSIDCTLVHKAEVRLADYQAIRDENITFQTDTGRTFVLRNAWCTGGLEISKSDVRLKFEGLKCEET